MRYSRSQVTNAGAELFAHSLAEKKDTVMTSIIISDTQLSDSYDLSNAQLSDFGDYIVFPVMYIRKPSDKVVQPGTVIGNTNITVTSQNQSHLDNIRPVANGQEGDITSPYTVKSALLMGKTDGEDNETIIDVAAAEDGEAVTIPANTDIPYNLTYDFALTFNNSANNNNITMTVSNAGMVNFSDMENYMKDYELIANAVQDNHDGTITFNDTILSLNSMIDPNADLFAINKPGVWISQWGYQTSLKNFPSGDGAAVIIAEGMNRNGFKLTVIDSWGAEFYSYQNNGNFGAWQQPVSQNDVTNAINVSKGYTDQLKNAGFIYRGVWNGAYGDLQYQPDGYYALWGNTNTNAGGDTINGFDGWGIAQVRHTSGDAYITIDGHVGDRWVNRCSNTWQGWRYFGSDSNNHNFTGDLQYNGKEVATIDNINSANYIPTDGNGNVGQNINFNGDLQYKGNEVATSNDVNSAKNDSENYTNQQVEGLELQLGPLNNPFVNRNVIDLPIYGDNEDVGGASANTISYVNGLAAFDIAKKTIFLDGFFQYHIDPNYHLDGRIMVISTSMINYSSIATSYMNNQTITPVRDAGGEIAIELTNNTVLNGNGTIPLNNITITLQ